MISFKWFFPYNAISFHQFPFSIVCYDLLKKVNGNKTEGHTSFTLILYRKWIDFRRVRIPLHEAYNDNVHQKENVFHRKSKEKNPDVQGWRFENEFIPLQGTQKRTNKKLGYVLYKNSL